MAAPDLQEHPFSSSDVCRMAGVTLRQLQWWDERGILSPQQQGRRRLYESAGAIGMMVFAELRRKGLSLQKIRRLTRTVRREIERRQGDLLTGRSELFLLTDGKSTYFEDQPARVIDLLKRSRRPLLLVSVSEQAARIVEFRKAEAEAARRGHKRQLDLF
jgi:DNA-binding transcriptional MerR regulator